MNYQELLRSPLLPSETVPLVQKASHNNATVLILGEPGTEKELIARIIHHTGEWKDYRFYRLDCKILTEDAFLDQLSRVLKDVKQTTLSATFYLREIGYLGQSAQARLLELLEDGLFQNGVQEGGIRNVRFISSSSEHLEEKIAQGRFSEELYDRLSTLMIRISPLRDRIREIPSIAQYILVEKSKKTKMKTVEISNQVLKLLQSYWWPGNLRELEQVILRSAILSEGVNLVKKDLFAMTENGRNPFISFLKKTELESLPEPRGGDFSNEEKTFLWSLFLMELVHRIKNPLVSIKTFTQLLREKFNDPEYRDHFYRIVTEDIEKIDLVLNGLLDYIKVNSPMNKSDTVHFILEEVLKKHEHQLEGKKIKIFRKFEGGLPETILHDEQLRYIFDSILQYVIPATPPAGSIGFLTKSLALPERSNTSKPLLDKDPKWVEILIVFTGYKRFMDQYETVLGIPAAQKEDAIELELRLVREVVERNRGVMRFEVNKKKPRTLISLRLPMERRKVIYYQPAGT